MCDAASNTGYGYQILQEGQDGRLHAVSYEGKALTKAQTRWLPAELELAAVCLALKEIDVFAVHRDVIVSHTRTVVRERCKGDDASQWENGKFDPLPPPNPITDRHKKLHR